MRNILKISVIALVVGIVGLVFLSKTGYAPIVKTISESGLVPAVSMPNEEIKSEKKPLTEVAQYPEEEPTVPKQEALPAKIILDVPIIKQMDAPRLYNGCEVTSLAMLLNYYGMNVTKNELATKILRVPLKYPDGTYGNPYVGFVGDMENGPGLGVYHKPIFQLASAYVDNGLENLTKKPFSVLLDKVGHGQPVWVIITATFSPVGSLDTWTTPQGKVNISYKMHSVVITGYDENSLYINDPYGGKNKRVNKENFIKAWEQMGAQAITINKN